MEIIICGEKMFPNWIFLIRMGIKKLIIYGKQSKERSVFLADGAITALNSWLKIREADQGLYSLLLIDVEI
jgi:site-specific recombinase XerC